MSDEIEEQGAGAPEEPVSIALPRRKANGGGMVHGTTDQSWKEEARKLAEQERRKTERFDEALTESLDEALQTMPEPEPLFPELEPPFPDAEQRPPGPPDALGPIQVEVHPAVVDENGQPVVNLLLAWQEYNEDGGIDTRTRTATLMPGDATNVAIGIFNALTQATIMAQDRLETQIRNNFFLRITASPQGIPDFGKAMQLGQRFTQFREQTLRQMAVAAMEEMTRAQQAREANGGNP